MRSYAPYDRKKQGSDAGKKKERKDRSAEEWDLRIDCTMAYAEEIVQNLMRSSSVLEYALVSGIEKGDSEALSHGSKENHVHIALVFKYKLRRDQALATCRGLLKKTDEYAVPRNSRFPYAGWFLHHTKADWKLIKEPYIRYEFGLLPRDPVDDDTKKIVQRMFKKFGTGGSTEQENDNRQRFAEWLE